MNIAKEEKKQGALRRLHVLADRFILGPKLENYFRQDRLYYFYGYSMGKLCLQEELHCCKREKQVMRANAFLRQKKSLELFQKSMER